MSLPISLSLSLLERARKLHCAFVLCFVMGYVLMSGKMSHRRVHYIYILSNNCESTLQREIAANKKTRSLIYGSSNVLETKSWVCFIVCFVLLFLLLFSPVDLFQCPSDHYAVCAYMRLE